MTLAWVVLRAWWGFGLLSRQSEVKFRVEAESTIGRIVAFIHRIFSKVPMSIQLR